jgi:galacturonosyltransferase
MQSLKKTVLFLVNHDVVIYNFRLELVERLIADGHEVHISSPYGERIDDLVKLGAKYHEIKIARHGTNPVTDGVLIWSYIKLLKQVKPNIVFSYTIKPNIYGGIACRLMNVPQVANVTGLGTAVENPGLTQKITLALYRFAFKKIQRIFFQNTENCQFFIDHNLFTDKHGLLPGSGVNLERFAPLPYPDETDGIHFVFISRIMCEKGIEQYLAAAAHFKGCHPERSASGVEGSKLHFHICGFCESEYQGKLEEYAKNGIVIYHGMVRDVREVLKKVHCTIHPSFYPEGISNVLLESCACARPIITTDRSGCREVVNDCVNGFVVKQRDSEDLIQKIEKFLALSHEQKMQMGLAGRAKVEHEFDRQIVVDAYLKEMEKV